LVAPRKITNLDRELCATGQKRDSIAIANSPSQNAGAATPRAARAAAAGGGGDA